jgi:hypothetical protein
LISREVNFLTVDTIEPFASVVTNPPFDQAEFIIKKACLHAKKVAAVFPVRSLNAAGKWLQKLPLSRIWFLTPRPSMPPGHVALDYERRGKTPAGGKVDFCWLVFDCRHVAPGHPLHGEWPRVGWLHRDPESQQ